MAQGRLRCLSGRHRRRRGHQPALPPRLGRRSEEHTSELQSHHDLVCRLLLEKKKTKKVSIVVARDEIVEQAELADRHLLALLEGLLRLDAARYRSCACDEDRHYADVYQVSYQ